MRRPPVTRELPKSLKVRLTKQLAAKIERLREYRVRSCGRTPSPSELVGEALESAPLLSDPPVGWVENPAEALATAWKVAGSETAGSRNLWVYISHLINLAYEHTQRRYVSANLLTDAMLAFRAVYLGYRTTQHKRAGSATIVRTFRRNFGAPYNANLLAIVDELAERVSAQRVESWTALQYSRNLHILLRELAASQWDTTLTDELRPHLPSLLLLATKGFWYSAGREPLPLSTSRLQYVQALRAPREALRQVQNGITVTLNDEHEDLPWSLTLHDGKATLSGIYPAWQDLTALFIDNAESGDFREVARSTNPDGVQVWNKSFDSSVFLSPDDFRAVGLLLRKILEDERLAHVFGILDKRFGRI